jgi:transposase
MKALSMDLRERILAAVEEGSESMPKIAARFAVSHKMVQKLKYQWRDLGTLQPQTHKVGRKRVLTEKQCQRLGELVRDDPSLTLEQLRTKVRLSCCLKTIWLELRRQVTLLKKVAPCQ